MTNIFLLFNRKTHKKSDAKTKSGQKPILGIIKVADIHYLDDGHPGHLLDIYYPAETPGLLPTIVDIHGGGWVYGAKELNEYQAIYLASRGFAVVNIDYRLCPEVHLDGQVQDVFSAMAWIEDHGAEYHCDITRLFLTGDSAGGHLSLLTAMAQNSEKLQAIYNIKRKGLHIHAVAVTCPVALLHKMVAGKDWPLSFLRLWIFGPRPMKNPIIHFAGVDDIITLGTLPETIIVTTKGDKNFYPYSVALDTLLTEHQVKHVFKTYEPQVNHLDHVFNVLYPNYIESMQANDDIAAFFKSFVHITV